MTLKAGPWQLGINFQVLPAQFATANLWQDAKYIGYNGLIYNRATGVAIPPWEPTFLFRAKDDLAAEALQGYQQRLQERYDDLRAKLGPTAPLVLATAQHLWIVTRRVADFMLYRHTNAADMKPADTASQADTPIYKEAAVQ